MITRRYLLLLLSIILIITTGCAETPTEDIVYNKNDNTLINKIDSSTENTPTQFTSTNISDSFYNDAKTVLFNVDASLIVPATDTIHIFKAAPHFFDTEELRIISNVICQNNEIFEYTEVLSKEELEILILETKQLIGDKDHLIDYYNNDEDVINYALNQYEIRLAELESDYLSAPDFPIKTPSDFQYHPDSYYAKGESYIIGSSSIDGLFSMKATSLVNDVPMFIWSGQRNDDLVLSNIFAYPFDYKDMQNESYYHQQTTFDDDDLNSAILMVQTALKDMNLSNWFIESYTTGKNAVYFNFVLKYNNIPMAFDQNWWTLSQDSTYSPKYTYPSLEMTVSNNQIQTFMFEGPLDIVEILNENVSILPYDEIIERIYSQLEISWSLSRIGEYCLPDANIDPVDGSINITSIELVYVRTLIENDSDNYYIVPAWIIRGSPQLNKYMYNGSTYELPENSIKQDIPLLVINAVDGSVIDMSQGY